MGLRHALAVTLVTLSLPSAALAQSGGAGDDQYSDPFGSDATPTATPKPATTDTAQPATAAATATPAPAAPAATPAAQPQLPYTGVDAWPLALGGALALGAGVTLRARLRDDD
jgi:cell division septation protein DedD